jgi:hypothetical protein
MDLDLFTTLTAAKEFWEDHIDTKEGAICPCCEIFGRIYRRPFNTVAIQALAALYRHTKLNGEGFYHYLDFFGKPYGDFPKFTHLKLIVRATNDDPVKRTSGTYKIQQPGIAFVESRLAIPSRLCLGPGNELLEVFGEQKRIGEFWPEFNFTDLMQT